MNIFPFTLPHGDGRDLFRAYAVKHLERLNEAYGHVHWFGTEAKKSWSYYDVTVEVIDSVTVCFTTYGMADAVYGGRGAEQESFTARCKGLAKCVAAEQRRIAIDAYHERRAASAARLEEEAVAAIERELFP